MRYVLPIIQIDNRNGPWCSRPASKWRGFFLERSMKQMFGAMLGVLIGLSIIYAYQSSRATLYTQDQTYSDYPGGYDAGYYDTRLIKC
jgi:hypothetical protein